MYADKPQSFWENMLWTDETKLELFGRSHQSYIYRRKNEAFKEKNNMPIMKHGGGSDILGLSCCLRHRVPWICAGHNEIRRLSSHFGEKYTVQSQKSVSSMVVQAGQWPHTCIKQHSRMDEKKTLDLSWSGLLWVLIWIPLNIFGKTWNLQLGDSTHQTWQNWSSLPRNSGPN